MKTSIKAPLGASLIILSSVFYASYGIWTKLMGDFFGGYTAAGLRSVLVLLLLIPIATLYHKWESLKLKDNWPYIVGMIIVGLLMWGPFYYAILHAGVGTSLAVSYAGIVIGSFFFGWLFAGERFTKGKIGSALLGFVGVGLIFAPNMADFVWLALGAAFVSGVAVGANTVFAKKIKYNATQSTVMLWATGVVSNAIMVPLIGEPMPAIGWHVEWLYLVFFALASVVASWTMVKGIKLIDAGAASILGLTEIVFAIMFGVVFFGEQPGILVLVGAAVIIAAAAIPYINDYKVKKDTV